MPRKTMGRSAVDGAARTLSPRLPRASRSAFTQASANPRSTAEPECAHDVRSATASGRGPCSFLASGCIFDVETSEVVLMRTRIQRWGNSLAVRIPKSFATETALGDGSEVDLTLEDGRLVITPLAESPYSLEELLAGITPENLHAAIDFGSSVGAEAW